MSKFETTFRHAIATAERDVMIAQIRATPLMTLGELGKFSSGEFGVLIKGITIGDLLGQGAPTRPASAKAAKTPAPKGRKSGRKETAKPARRARAAKSTEGEGAESSGSRRGEAVDTRTPAAREAYDAAVLEALKAAGGSPTAPELSATAGGTPLQVRTALGRLIARGLVTWTGQARGTRYSLV